MKLATPTLTFLFCSVNILAQLNLESKSVTETVVNFGCLQSTLLVVIVSGPPTYSSHCTPGMPGDWETTHLIRWPAHSEGRVWPHAWGLSGDQGRSVVDPKSESPSRNQGGREPLYWIQTGIQSLISPTPWQLPLGTPPGTNSKLDDDPW